MRESPPFLTWLGLKPSKPAESSKTDTNDVHNTRAGGLNGTSSPVLPSSPRFDRFGDVAADTSMGRNHPSSCPSQAPAASALLESESSPQLENRDSGPLIRISLSKLIANEPLEVKRLLTACRELGAFYLDIRTTQVGERILSEAERLFDVGSDLFALPEEDKREYEMSKFGGYYGYKGYRNRTLDMKEFYTVSKDDILSLPCTSLQMRHPQPAPINASRPLIKSYIDDAHTIISLLLSRLTLALKLPCGALENIHRRTANSGDQVRWIKLQPSQEPRPAPGDEILLDEHSDSNSLTLLFNRLGGLQMRAPHAPPTPYDEDDDSTTTSSTPSTTHANHHAEYTFNQPNEDEPVHWIAAEPIPGHCIILLGEQIAKLTHDALRVNVHRVCVLEGPENSIARQSLVYFSRPEDDVILKQLAGITVVPRPDLRRHSSKRMSKVLKQKRREWTDRWAKTKSRIIAHSH
ncbi:hypothetical protein FQN57_000256 [Myotisia sp. PD_48]|nr:hypothetical protein FQN57_000256 [Myotisia sp. PD_48]